jgi:hypothetical protein
MKMHFKQLQQAVLQQAEKEAPPPPSLEWIREQLAEAETPPEPKVQRWWQKEAWLWTEAPTRVATAEGLNRPTPEASSPDEIGERPVIGTIPAYVRKGQEKVRVPVTVTPQIQNGHLFIGIKETEELFTPNQKLRWTLIATPKGQPLEVEAAKEDYPGRGHRLLKFKLPSELLEEWQGIENWDWRWLPFRFLIEKVKPDKEQETKLILLFAVLLVALFSRKASALILTLLVLASLLIWNVSEVNPPQSTDPANGNPLIAHESKSTSTTQKEKPTAEPIDTPSTEGVQPKPATEIDEAASRTSKPKASPRQVAAGDSTPAGKPSPPPVPAATLKTQTTPETSTAERTAVAENRLPRTQMINGLIDQPFPKRVGKSDLYITVKSFAAPIGVEDAKSPSPPALGAYQKIGQLPSTDANEGIRIKQLILENRSDKMMRKTMPEIAQIVNDFGLTTENGQPLSVVRFQIAWETEIKIPPKQQVTLRVILSPKTPRKKVSIQRRENRNGDISVN